MGKVAALGRSRSSSFTPEAASTPDAACPCFFVQPPGNEFP